MIALSDEDLESKALLQAYLKGDGSAFDTLYGKHAGSVRAMAATSLGTPASDPRVDDMTQETWLALIEGAETYRESDEAGFLTWLLGITANKCRMELRRAKREATLLARFANSGIPREAPAPSYEDLDGDDFARDLEQAVARLPAEQRDAFGLRHDEGLTVREISLRTRLSRSWVNDLIELGFESLRKALAKYGPDARLAKIRAEAFDGVPRPERKNR